VLDKFKHKLPKEDLKRFGKQLNKGLVESDYKNNRVEDPTRAIGVKQQRKIKRHVKNFLDRAVVKFKEIEAAKTSRDQKSNAVLGANQTELPNAAGSSTTDAQDMQEPESTIVDVKDIDVDADDIIMTDDDEPDDSPSESDLKRKREEDTTVDSHSMTPSDTPSAKRMKEDEMFEPTPPPPPPPPPEGAVESSLTEEEQALREQEEALMRENEEAQRLEDEAEHNNPSRERAPVESNGENTQLRNAKQDISASGRINTEASIYNDRLVNGEARMKEQGGGVGNEASMTNNEPSPAIDEENNAMDHEQLAGKQELLGH
jgi:[histone H3]-lysine36 N-trimethyltransferase